MTSKAGVEKIEQRVSFGMSGDRDKKDKAKVLIEKSAKEAYAGFAKKPKLAEFKPRRIFVNSFWADSGINEIRVARGVTLPVEYVKNVSRYDVAVQGEKNGKK